MSSTLDFICGVAAGWSQVITGQPLDFIKTKFQVSNSQNASASQFAKEIIKDHGFMGFYRGASSLFFGFSFSIAVQFAIYEACKKYLLKGYQDVVDKIPEEVLSIKQIMLSGAVVGFSVAFISCPIEYVKIQKQVHAKTKESSFMLLMREMYQNQIKNIYKGFSAGLLREIIGTMFYYSTYEFSVRKMCQLKDIPRRCASSLDYLLSGSMAGLTYWTVAYPLDVIKTKLQSGQKRSKIFKQFYKNAYRGFSVISVRSVIVNGVSFATFEQMKKITQNLNFESS